MSQQIPEDLIPEDLKVTTASDALTSTSHEPAPDATAPDEPASDGTVPNAETRRRRARRLAIEWIILIGLAIGIALVIKSFLFQAFYIPSGSMEPTLNIGDRVIVNKLSYDVGDVSRGDIVVFKAPTQARSGGIEDLVKRVIGLPGDTIEFRDHKVYLDNKRLREPYLKRSSSQTDALSASVPPGCAAPPSGQPGCVVPPDRVFVMGDNRGNSQDGRIFGPIKESSIVGRAFVRIWPFDDISFL